MSIICIAQSSISTRKVDINSTHELSMFTPKSKICLFLTSLLLLTVLAPILSIVEASSSRTNTSSSNPPIELGANIGFEFYYPSTSAGSTSSDGIAIAFDELDNIYVASNNNSFFSFSKVSNSGGTMWSKSLNLYSVDNWGRCNSCTFESIEVVGPDEFYFIFSVVNAGNFELLQTDPQTGQLTALGPVSLSTPSDGYTAIIYHNPTTGLFESVERINRANFNLDEIKGINIDSNIDADDNLVVTSREDYSGSYSVHSINNTGTRWTTSIVSNYTITSSSSSSSQSDFQLRSDVSGTDIHYLIQTKETISVNGTDMSCPSSSELEMCYIFLRFDVDGNFLHSTVNNPRVTFTSFAIRNGNAYLGGVTGYLDDCTISCNSTNFTGTPISHNNNRSLVFASLNLTNQNWNYAHVTNLETAVPSSLNSGPASAIVRGILPSEQNLLTHQNGSITYMYSCLNNTFLLCQEEDLEINGTNISSQSNVEDQLIFITLDDQGSYQWHTSIGCNCSSSGSFIPFNEFNVAYSKSHDLAALFVEHSDEIVANNGASSQMVKNDSQYGGGALVFINTANGTIIDTDISAVGNSNNYRHPLSITPGGRVLTVNYIDWYQDSQFNYVEPFLSLGTHFAFFESDNDLDGVSFTNDNCPSVYNPEQVDYDSDFIGDMCDLDDDNDGINDTDDLCPRLDSALNWISQINNSNPASTTDWDSDGCQDELNEDADDDNDGIPDPLDECPRGIIGLGNDTDGEGCKDLEDSDDDNDLKTDAEDFCPVGELGWISGKVTDFDGDGCNDDSEDFDDDNDGVTDDIDLCPKGELNWKSNINTDFNGDGCLDSIEDEDNDNDGVENYADICQNSNGIVDVNGCTTEQLLLLYPDSNDNASNNTTPPIMFVCRGGTAVVLNVDDCPPFAGENETNNTIPVIMYVCQGGTAVVIDISDCPQNTISDNSTTNDTSFDNTTQSPAFYYVCPGGEMIALDFKDCADSVIDSEQPDRDLTADLSSGGDDNDDTLSYMVGGAFILSIISILVAILRPNGTKSLDDIELMVKSHQSDDLEIFRQEKTEVNEIPVDDKPPKFLEGSISEGYEWIKWPEKGGQDWYRLPGTDSDWMKWD